MRIVLSILMLMLLTGCVTPTSTVRVYAFDEEGTQKITKKVEIDQTRLGETKYDDGEVKLEYDSKGKSLLVGATETVTEVGKVITLDKVLD